MTRRESGRRDLACRTERYDGDVVPNVGIAEECFVLKLVRVVFITSMLAPHGLATLRVTGNVLNSDPG